MTKDATISPEIKKRIEDKILETYLLAQKQFNKSFDLCKLSIENLGSRVRGLAYSGQNLIKINSVYLNESAEHCEGVINTTVPHEIAHLITDNLFPNAKQAHGPEWKSVMIKLGLPPVRCHSMAIPSARPFVWECNCQKWQVSRIVHHRMQTESIRTCRKCKKAFRFVNKIN